MVPVSDKLRVIGKLALAFMRQIHILKEDRRLKSNIEGSDDDACLNSPGAPKVSQF